MPAWGWTSGAPARTRGAGRARARRRAAAGRLGGVRGFMAGAGGGGGGGGGWCGGGGGGGGGKGVEGGRAGGGGGGCGFSWRVLGGGAGVVSAREESVADDLAGPQSGSGSGQNATLMRLPPPGGAKAGSTRGHG